MANIILLIFCLVIGVILRRIKVLPVSAPATLNGLIVNLFVPAITLRYAANMEFSKVTFLPVIAAWLVFVGAFIFFNITKKWTRFDRQTIGALIVVSGISSISFVGYPLFELMYGTVGLQSGIVMSQAGTFLICSTVGIFTVSIYSDESKNPDWNKIIRDILKFPPFIALLLAVFIKCTGYNLPFYSMPF